LDSERKTIARAKRDIKEFDILYRKYFPRINNFVYHRVIEDDLIRDEIISNVFFKAMKKIDLFRFLDSKKSSFSAWLYRIAVNEINQFYRNRKRSDKIKNEFKINRVPTAKSYPDFEIVRKKMTILSSEEQNLITLRFFEKMKYKEIAEILKKKENAVKVKMHRIINKLRNSLKEEFNYE